MTPAARRPTSAERFAARSRRRALKRVAATLAGLAGLAGLGFVIWTIGWSSVLAVGEVHVEGAEDGLAEVVTEAAAVPIGTPLVRLDTDAIAARVREVAEVAEVEVKRSWPTAVTLEVEPRRPAARVPGDDTWWLVDTDGILFGKTDAPPESLPVLYAPLTEGTVAARAAGVAVAGGLPDELAGLVEEVRVESEADLRLMLTDGAEVYWGTAERSADKAEVLLALIAAQDEVPSGYDVSAPDRPAVEP